MTDEKMTMMFTFFRILFPSSMELHYVYNGCQDAQAKECHRPIPKQTSQLFHKKYCEGPGVSCTAEGCKPFSDSPSLEHNPRLKARSCRRPAPPSSVPLP